MPAKKYIQHKPSPHSKPIKRSSSGRKPHHHLRSGLTPVVQPQRSEFGYTIAGGLGGSSGYAKPVGKPPGYKAKKLTPEELAFLESDPTYSDDW